MSVEGRDRGLDVFAGPCSVSPEALEQLYEMAEIQVYDAGGTSQRAITGVRIVGLKSRTSLDTTGKGMGWDYPVIEQAIITGRNNDAPPSVLFAERFISETHVGVATEVMVPDVQMPHFVAHIPAGMMLPWQPSVMQLGWPVMQMAAAAKEKGWSVGIKNGKWLGASLSDVQCGSDAVTSMETAWQGVGTYALGLGCDVAYIHRGVDAPDKGDYRNAPVHAVVHRLAKVAPTQRRYFDPSHSYGPKMRDSIPQGTIDAMRMKTGDGRFLYDGLLIEAGTSKTDTEQHISISELKYILTEVAKFRRLNGPLLPK